MVERCGISNEEFDCLVGRIVSRGDEMPDSVERLAGVARAANVQMLSHDDATPAMRRAFRARGVGIAEFPVNEATAREAPKAAMPSYWARRTLCAGEAIRDAPRRPI
jgi:alpha-D-ribose 1-methylphosphonate 5-triphosphate diphosphatase